MYTDRASHIVLDYLQALKLQNKHIIFEKYSISCKKILIFAAYSIFQNDIFFLNFLISPVNFNIGPLTILYDLGHPAHYWLASPTLPVDFQKIIHKKLFSQIWSSLLASITHQYKYIISYIIYIISIYTIQMSEELDYIGHSNQLLL